jgi:hypothetical protein
MCLSIALLPFAIATAAESAQSHVFNGVVATFVLETPSIRVGQPLKVRYTLRNISKRPVHFRFMDLSEHARVYSLNGRELSLVNGAPIAESPTADIPLKPGETVRYSEELNFFGYYEMPPGKYYFRFLYNLDLLPDDFISHYRKKLSIRHWVIWDDHKYQFSVSR